MKEKLDQILVRLEKIEKELGDPEVMQDQEKYRKLTQDHSHLSEVRDTWEKVERLSGQLKDNRELLAEEKDEEFLAVLEEDIEKVSSELKKKEKELETLLVPPDPLDHRDTIVELRAGTGGDEAAIFVGDCVRMYKLFADHMGWKYDLLSCTPSDAGGFKEYIMEVGGKNVYRFMKYEAGTHRVQRVPKTETQGRVHTSAITVAVLPEPEEGEEVQIDEKDLRIDTFRSSGAGGQHVNTTDSAVRITHIPTGVVVACQEERSQHKNKEKAMRVLQAKILEAEQEKLTSERAETRSLQVGSGDRSGRIRTYNFPQNRVTDHRINFTSHKLEQMMQGDLEGLSQELIAYDHQKKLEDS